MMIRNNSMRTVVVVGHFYDGLVKGLSLLEKFTAVVLSGYLCWRSLLQSPLNFERGYLYWRSLPQLSQVVIFVGEVYRSCHIHVILSTTIPYDDDDDGDEMKDE